MADELLSYEETIAAYDPVLGLEVHVELGTHTKMFCGCATTFGAEPNTQVCPVCLGLPGSLPVVNEVGVESAIRIGLALHCQIAPWCRFARKNYFYPDMPKNFQTSQYDEPIAYDGWLDVDLPDGTTYRVAHRARPHGGGHRQVAARRRCHRTHPWRGLLARRLQPGRHTAHRDRHQAGDRHGGAGPGSGASLRGRAAGPAPRAGRLRRQDGAGLAAVRCQRVAAAPGRGGRGAGRGPARHSHRDQERQLAALGRARGPLRDAAAGRRAGPRGSRCCRRPVTGTRTPA